MRSFFCGNPMVSQAYFNYKNCQFLTHRKSPWLINHDGITIRRSFLQARHVSLSPAMGHGPPRFWLLMKDFNPTRVRNLKLCLREIDVFMRSQDILRHPETKKGPVWLISAGIQSKHVLQRCCSKSRSNTDLCHGSSWGIPEVIDKHFCILLYSADCFSQSARAKEQHLNCHTLLHTL